MKVNFYDEKKSFSNKNKFYNKLLVLTHPQLDVSCYADKTKFRSKRM